MAFTIDKIVLRQISMPLIHYFETSFERTTDRKIILVEVISSGVSGWGEVTASEHPYYNEEWTDSAWLLLKDYAGPLLAGRKLEAACEAAALFAPIRGHRMAWGGLETALWDLEARLLRRPLWRHIGGTLAEIPCGVSIGIQDTVPDLIGKVERELAAGYQRIKLKIKPGRDVAVLRDVRRVFPRVPLMADANSAYALADIEHLRRMDEFGLTMLEQPLGYDDIIDHAALQARLATPICLDESIRTAHHAEQAIGMNACRVINIKLGRVGGFTEARKVHDVAQAAGIPVWCGGMLESGIGRAHNIALSTLANFTLPGDVSASARYWERDVIVPHVEVTARGTIVPPERPGFGFEIDMDYLRSLTVRQEQAG